MDPTQIANALGAIGLSASAGLNAWIPLFFLGLSQRFGWVDLSGNYEQLGSTPALIFLGFLLVVDLIGDKIPAIDSVLHAVGLAVAPISGAIVFGAQASLISDTHPVVAAILGAALGGTVHTARGLFRPAVTAGTAGVGNPVVSAVEDVLAFALAFMAIVVPVLGFLALLVMAWFVLRRWNRWRNRSAAPPPQPTKPPNLG